MSLLDLRPNFELGTVVLAVRVQPRAMRVRVQPRAPRVPLPHPPGVQR